MHACACARVRGGGGGGGGGFLEAAWTVRWPGDVPWGSSRTALTCHQPQTRICRPMRSTRASAMRCSTTSATATTSTGASSGAGISSTCARATARPRTLAWSTPCVWRLRLRAGSRRTRSWTPTRPGDWRRSSPPCGSRRTGASTRVCAEAAARARRYQIPLPLPSAFQRAYRPTLQVISQP